MERSLIVGSAGTGQRLRMNSLYPSAVFLKHPPGVLVKAILHPSLGLSYLPTYDAREKRPLNRYIYLATPTDGKEKGNRFGAEATTTHCGYTGCNRTWLGRNL